MDLAVSQSKSLDAKEAARLLQLTSSYNQRTKASEAAPRGNLLWKILTSKLHCRQCFGTWLSKGNSDDPFSSESWFLITPNAWLLSVGPLFSKRVLFTCVIHYLTLHWEPSLQGEWLAAVLAWITSSDSDLKQKPQNNPFLLLKKKKVYTKKQQSPQLPHANSNKCPGFEMTASRCLGFTSWT